MVADAVIEEFLEEYSEEYVEFLEESETEVSLYAVILDNGGNESDWNVLSNGSEAKNYICQFDPNEGITLKWGFLDIW